MGQKGYEMAKTSEQHDKVATLVTNYLQHHLACRTREITCWGQHIRSYKIIIALVSGMEKKVTVMECKHDTMASEHCRIVIEVATLLGYKVETVAYPLTEEQNK
jgi:hypothetical protein